MDARDRLNELWQAAAAQGQSERHAWSLYRAALEAELLEVLPELGQAQQREAELRDLLTRAYLCVRYTAVDVDADEEPSMSEAAALAEEIEAALGQERDEE